MSRRKLRKPKTENLPAKRAEKMLKIYQQNVKRIAMRRRIRKTLGVLLAICVWAGCIYTMLVVAANSEMDESATWSKNFMITIVQDTFAMPLAKVFLTLYMLKNVGNVKKRWMWKIMRVFINKIVARSLAVAMYQTQEADSKKKKSKADLGAIVGVERLAGKKKRYVADSPVRQQRLLGPSPAETPTNIHFHVVRRPPKTGRFFTITSKQEKGTSKRVFLIDQ